jgi:predicted outer membrane repeat protein
MTGLGWRTRPRPRRCARMRENRGTAMIFTVLALGVLTVLGFGITSLGVVALHTSTNEREVNEVLAVADAGISHAKRLILWQEWGSFDQFLQRGDGAACNGDEVAGTPLVSPSPPYSPLPATYPTAASEFIPAAGRAFGANQAYVVQLCDDHATDIDPATGILDTNPNVDVNHRVRARSRGIGRNGASATIEIMIGASDTPAVIVNGDLEVKGNPTAAGAGGAIHANGDLTLTGNPCAQQYFSSVDTVEDSANAEGGTTCTNAAADTRPNSDPINIPLLSPSMYKDSATYWLTSDGRIMHKPMSTWVQITPIPAGSLLANWSAQIGGQQREWRANGDVPTGTYYVEANVVINGNLGASGAIALTILTEGFYKVTGNPMTTPHLTVPWRGPIAVIAGTDISLSASFSNPSSGLYYARHQLDVAGSPVINGQLIALNEADTPYPVTSNQTNNPVQLTGGKMELTGSPTINYSGNGLFAARMLSWRECRDLLPGDPNGPCGAP